MDYDLEFPGEVRYQSNLIRRILEESDFLNENVQFQIEADNSPFRSRVIIPEEILPSGIRYSVKDSLQKEEGQGTETKLTRYIVNNKQINRV